MLVDVTEIFFIMITKTMTMVDVRMEPPVAMTARERQLSVFLSAIKIIQIIIARSRLLIIIILNAA